MCSYDEKVYRTVLKRPCTFTKGRHCSLFLIKVCSPRLQITVMKADSRSSLPNGNSRRKKQSHRLGNAVIQVPAKEVGSSPIYLYLFFLSHFNIVISSISYRVIIVSILRHRQGVSTLHGRCLSGLNINVKIFHHEWPTFVLGFPRIVSFLYSAHALWSFTPAYISIPVHLYSSPISYPSIHFPNWKQKWIGKYERGGENKTKKIANMCTLSTNARKNI